MADKDKLEEQKKRAQQGRKKKENLEDKVGTATVKNLFAKKKMKALLGKKDEKNYKEDFKEFGDSRREVFAPFINYPLP